MRFHRLRALTHGMIASRPLCWMANKYGLAARPSICRPGRRGLEPAIQELLAQGFFRLKERRTEGIGLTVLERVAAADPAEAP
jgi:hypothetical protein